MDIVDVHIYQGQWHWPLRNGTLADTLAVMDRYGMTQGVAMPVNGIAYDFVEANADLAEELSQQQRVVGYVMINGNYVDESIEQFTRTCRPSSSSASKCIRVITEFALMIRAWSPLST